MTLSELIVHLQHLERQGHGHLRVVVPVSYESEPHILHDAPSIDSESFVWDTRAPCRLIKESHTYLILC